MALAFCSIAAADPPTASHSRSSIAAADPPTASHSRSSIAAADAPADDSPAPSVIAVVPDPVPQAPMLVEVAPPPRRPRLASYFGFTFDLGMPDLIGVAVAMRPIWWLRIVAGGNTDLFSGGLGGGVVFLPLRKRWSPSIALEAGHVFAAEVGGVPKAFGVNVDKSTIGYDYASAQAGVEFAATKRVSLSLRVGASFFDVAVLPDSANTQKVKREELGAWFLPTGKLAVTVWL